MTGRTLAEILTNSLDWDAQHNHEDHSDMTKQHLQHPAVVQPLWVCVVVPRSHQLLQPCLYYPTLTIKRHSCKYTCMKHVLLHSSSDPKNMIYRKLLIEIVISYLDRWVEMPDLRLSHQVPHSSQWLYLQVVHPPQKPQDLPTGNLPDQLIK